MNLLFCKKTSNENVQKYLIRFEACEWTLRNLGILLQPFPTGLHLLESAGIKEHMKQLIYAQIDLENEDDMYENIKKLLKNIKEDENTSNFENETYFNWKSKKSNYKGTKLQTSPFPYKCFNCQEIGHMSRDCKKPKEKGNKDASNEKKNYKTIEKKISIMSRQKKVTRKQRQVLYSTKLT